MTVKEWVLLDQRMDSGGRREPFRQSKSDPRAPFDAGMAVDDESCHAIAMTEDKLNDGRGGVDRHGIQRTK